MKKITSGFISIPTFKHFPENNNDSSGTYSECKVKGNIIRVDKGKWDNVKQDWRACIVFDTGVIVESSLWYGEFASQTLGEALKELYGRAKNNQGN